MKDCKLKEALKPGVELLAPLTELLKAGARGLIKQAVETDLACCYPIMKI